MPDYDRRPRITRLFLALTILTWMRASTMLRPFVFRNMSKEESYWLKRPENASEMDSCNWQSGAVERTFRVLMHMGLIMRERLLQVWDLINQQSVFKPLEGLWSKMRSKTSALALSLSRTTRSPKSRLSAGGGWHGEDVLPHIATIAWCARQKLLLYTCLWANHWILWFVTSE